MGAHCTDRGRVWGNVQSSGARHECTECGGKAEFGAMYRVWGQGRERKNEMHRELAVIVQMKVRLREFLWDQQARHSLGSPE